MIILEGPDGSGKTTLAHRLSQDLSIQIEPKVVQSDMTTTIDVFDWMMKEMDTWPKKALYDRFALISEYIYGPIFSGGVREGFNDRGLAKKAFREFRRSKPVVVYCLPSLETVYFNVANDPLNVEASAHIRAVYFLYLQKAYSKPDNIIYDFTNPSSYAFTRTMIRDQAWERNNLAY